MKIKARRPAKTPSVAACAPCHTPWQAKKAIITPSQDCDGCKEIAGYPSTSVRTNAAIAD